VFPQLSGKIIGGNYPLPPLRQAASTAASIAAYSAMALMLAGNKIMGMLGFGEGQLPAWLVKLQQSRMAGIAVFFGLNMLSTQLASTGAFEVSIVAGEREKLGWSTIAHGGRVPRPMHLAKLLADAGLVPLPEFDSALAEQ
jgi:hypothetical protein